MVTSGLVFPNLKQEVLCLQLEPKVRVDDVDEVVDDVSEAAGDDERLPAKDVGPRSGKHRDHNSGPRLQPRNIHISITVICGYSDTFLTGLNCSRT